MYKKFCNNLFYANLFHISLFHTKFFHKILFQAALIFLLCGSKIQIFAAPGSLDTTFNPGGVKPGTKTFQIDPAELTSYGYSVAMQSDGKIVVAGFVDMGLGIGKFAVARLNPDGSFDTSFNQFGVEGQPGTASTKIDNNDFSQANAVAIQANGRIVLAGETVSAGDYKIALARFYADGTLDTTFNAGGIRHGTISIEIENNTFSVAKSVAIQKDDQKIVVCGITRDVSNVIKFAVARFTTTGELDTSFNNTGVNQGTASTTIDNNNRNSGYSVTIQQDGRIVLAGYTTPVTGTNRFAVARYTTNGIIDTSFNFGGVQQGTNSVAVDNNTSSACTSLALQTDEKIVTGGYTIDAGGAKKFALARFNTDGSVDTSNFNSSGSNPGTVSTTVESNTNCSGNSVAIQKSGKIVIGGAVNLSAGNTNFGLARFKTDGIIDTNFNAGGVQKGTVSTPVDNNINNQANSITIQDDGKIVLAGYSGSGSGPYKFAQNKLL